MSDTWYAVVDGSGTLVSTGTVLADDADLSAAGLHAIALAADPTGQVWDVATQTFSPPPAPSVITVLAFIKRFTVAEYQAIYASADPVAALFRLELDHAPGGMIDLLSADVQTGLQYLVSMGLLTESRATEVGTP